MRIFLYPRLGTCSKRSFLKTKKRYGQPKPYKPRGQLLQRLAAETGWTIDQVHEQLLRERDVLLKLKGIEK
ncbi:hypothetical protein FEK30_13255 [Picosynechococcus sp. PCC 11901]|nr:hypothetical protein FEK30_13255 [Picosynechococcus sp. PCC 11901]